MGAGWSRRLLVAVDFLRPQQACRDLQGPPLSAQGALCSMASAAVAAAAHDEGRRVGCQAPSQSPVHQPKSAVAATQAATQVGMATQAPSASCYDSGAYM